MGGDSSFARLCVRVGLFKGKNLAEELGFVRYFHYHPANVALHLVGFHLFLVSVLMLLARVHAIADWALVLLYVIGMLALEAPHVAVGTCAAVVLSALCLLTRQLLLLRGASFPFISVGSAAIGGALQLWGHVYYDRSQPAFRAFEAFFTTPFYLYLHSLWALTGYRSDLMHDVRGCTLRWKGVERVVYGERAMAEE